jgi:hypothetical protein
MGGIARWRRPDAPSAAALVNCGNEPWPAAGRPTEVAGISGRMVAKELVDRLKEDSVVADAFVERPHVVDHVKMPVSVCRVRRRNPDRDSEVRIQSLGRLR